jgi:hypothetical protein
VAERKSVLIRIDPVLHDALQRWAAAEFRSLNGQIEFVLRRAVVESGGMTARPMGRPDDGKKEG